MLQTFSSPKHALSVGGTTVKTSEFPLQSVVSFSFIVNLHSRLDKVGFLSTYCMISSSVNTLLQIAISSTYRSGCDGSVGLYQEEKAKKLDPNVMSDSHFFEDLSLPFRYNFNNDPSYVAIRLFHSWTVF